MVPAFAAHRRWQRLAVFTAVLLVAMVLGKVATAAGARDGLGYHYDLSDAGWAQASAARPVDGADQAINTKRGREPVGESWYDDPANPARSVARVDDGALAPQTLGSGVRGLANAGDELAQGGVYALRDPVTGQVVRTGRTNSLLRRQGEHFRDPRLSDYEFEVIARTDVYAKQRRLEQMLHDAYSPALNRINPISATNPNRAWYLSEAERFMARYGGGM